MRPTQEFRARPPVCELCRLLNGEPFLASAVMPLCRSVRSATALFCRLFLRLRGSDSDRVMLKLDYTARGFITAARRPGPGDRAYDLVAVLRHFLKNPMERFVMQ